MKGWKNLFSNYGIYDQAGELCVGSLKGHRELAIELDMKQVAGYLRSDKEEVILGCRLIVEIIGGREDRLMFFAKFPADEIKPDTIINFYKTAKEEIEEAEFESGRYYHKKFKVLGLWKKGDIEGITKYEIPEMLIKRIIGKLVLVKKVSVASPDLFYNISLIAKVVQEMRSDLKLGFKFAVSVFPLNVDLLIRPEYENADVDIKGGFLRIREVFEKVYDIHRRDKENFKSRAELEKKLVKELEVKDVEEIYRGIRDENEKGEMEKILFENNIFWKGAVSNAIRRIMGEKDYELLDALVNKSFYMREKEERKFTESIEGALDTLSTQEAIELLGIVLRRVEMDERW